MDDFSLWDVFISLFWFMLLVAWISLLFRIATDVFRDDELSDLAVLRDAGTISPDDYEKTKVKVLG